MRINRFQQATSLALIGLDEEQNRQFALKTLRSLCCEVVVGDKVTDLACGACASCRSLHTLPNDSFNLIEPEEGSFKVEHLQPLFSAFHLKPLRKFRMFYFSQAQVMHLAFANALLKAVEEPPPNTLMWLSAPTFSGLIPTLRSRLIRYSVVANRKFKSDHHELSSLAHLTLESTDQQNEAWAELRTLFKDRDKALEIVGLWQEILRMQLAQTLAGQESSSSTESVQLRQKCYSLFNHCLQMEQDLQKHLDRGILLDRFALKLQTIDASSGAGSSLR